VIPTNTKVRFLITANDVIHSWWVPEIAVKRDAIPGLYQRSVDRVPKRAFIAASARSYAALITVLCR
jgi:heme/copper-type cytochrome/quinol oxidase subunit 2